jgi:glycosyltransferase involved in cell wall biosynthesis
MKKRLFFVVNVDWFFLSHRLPIALKALSIGYEVFVLSSSTTKKEIIESHGIKFIDVPFERSKINFFKEIYVCIKLLLLYIKYKPDIIHHITLKPVIYGSFVSKFISKSKVINSISGLGYNFIDPKSLITKKIIITLLKIVHKRKNIIIIFQNNDDLEQFKILKIVTNINDTVVIKGSGVDLNKFKASPLPLKEKIILLFPARMLWDKGVKELKEATEILKKDFYNKITFILAGMVDFENKSCVDKEYLINWQDGEYVKWLGHVENMQILYEQSDIVILPSYREGLPKSLAEACSTGRPIITTNAIGCKDCVDNRVNGLIVPVKSIQDLADAISWLVDNRIEMIKMGKMSRIKAETDFNIDQIVNQHIQIYN